MKCYGKPLSGKTVHGHLHVGGYPMFSRLLWAWRDTWLNGTGFTQFYLPPRMEWAIRHSFCKHSPDGVARARWHTSASAYYSIYRPQKDERLSWPSWLTYSERLTHISGHPSATGRVRQSKTGVLPLCIAANNYTMQQSGHLEVVTLFLLSFAVCQIMCLSPKWPC